ncbi:MAG: outer membrane beta-barrel protein [Paludibacteraceae bacterium]|nr:outer membrane beta-barrel protein [Paludibacteraceae bacterium]
MNRLRVLCSVVFMTIVVGCWAEANDSQHLGIQLGFNRPLLREATALAPSPTLTVAMNGIKAGLVYDATLVKGFGLTIAVNYTIANTYGRWIDGKGLTKYPQTRLQYTMQTVELPIDWQYKFMIAQDTYLILYTGPKLEYDFIFNKVNYTRDVDGNITKNTTGIYTIDSDNDGKTDYSKFNITWGVGAGFQYKNYYLRGGYDFGILNPYSDRYHNIEQYDRRGRLDAWNIRLGLYFFNF